MRRHAHLRSVALACITVLGVALWSTTREAATQSSPFIYTVTDLGTLGGASSVALGSASDIIRRIVGYSQNEEGYERAFHADVNGMHEIGTLGGARSEARGVEWPFVVGRAQVASGAHHAFAFDYRNATVLDLGTLGGTESYATATAGGVIVGVSHTAGDAATRAFRYESGAMQDLGASLGGPNTAATGIHGFGHVVGYADLPGGAVHHAFLYADGVTTDLGTLGGNSEALATNYFGVVVGRSQLSTGHQRAFRYADGLMQDLGTLGGAASEALAIDWHGTIVGWAHDSSGDRRAFVWRDGVMTDLNTLIPPDTGWVLQAATGVTDYDSITGYGTLNGELRAFVLTPPVDLQLDLRVHPNNLDTNIPHPHEAGQTIWLGATISIDPPHVVTGLTLVDTISGPVEYVDWDGADCEQDGQRLTCAFPPLGGVFHRTVFIRVRTTGAGEITHSATIRADQFDPNLSNNSASEGNRALSLASLTLNPTTVVGGKSSLGRATITSPTGSGGSRIPLSSSHPDVASVPVPFDILPWSGDGVWREFYVTTQPVSEPTTVHITASYGLVTKTVPLIVLPEGYQMPYGGSPWPIPGTIQAEDFDEGGQGVAYHDSGRGNDGGGYRATDVDIEATADTGGGYNVGWIAVGEWLEYTAHIATSGTYALEARVASPAGGGIFHVEVDGVDKTGAMTIPNTGGWQAWTTIARTVQLESGVRTVRVSFDGNGGNGAVGNVNYLRFVGLSGGPTPYGGTPRVLPGVVQAEDFDEGGRSVAYFDRSSGNTGGQYRATDVDLERTGDSGGGFNVGWMSAGEWLNYTVDAFEAGTYTLTARVAANGAGGRFHVEFGGEDKTGPLTIPNTGGWQAWTDVTATVTLAAGVQWMRFVADQNGPTGVFGNLNYFRLESTSTVEPSEVVLYAGDLGRHGAWSLSSDSTAAGGQKALTPDMGWATAPTPLANPTDYLEATFHAPAGTPYTLWLRLRATGDTKWSESVWVQYSDARASGSPVYPIGTTSGLLVNLEPCNSCGVSGWGWQNGAYWLTQATTVTFATSGAHTIRIQVREDGAQLDQVILSPSRYLNSAPGPVKNDTTIVPK